MRILPPQKLITCILPHGIALDVLQRLKDEKGIIEASTNTARGMGRLTPLAHRGLGEQAEKDILTVIVSAAEADEIFAWLFGIARIDRPHGGLIYLTALGHATPFVLPELPQAVPEAAAAE
ncbi:MAG: hypothetical protein A3H91_14000 [Gammaproteobacteria bacterium RIFCSPLOWO2_02_FULL_61_13]|nr:MAG: hypothetical protein A3H91_14000 [Gammaproteobacteria bacterium RIFCSPLOWO2_02_FULL_61_13]